VLFDKLDAWARHVRRVEPVELVKTIVSSQSSSSCRACRAVLFDKLATAKMHGFDNVERDVTIQVELGLYRKNSSAVKRE